MLQVCSKFAPTRLQKGSNNGALLWNVRRMSVAQKMMQKMGWSAGKGLGKTNQVIFSKRIKQTNKLYFSTFRCKGESRIHNRYDTIGKTWATLRQLFIKYRATTIL
jgi:hypothetical protein